MLNINPFYKTGIQNLKPPSTPQQPVEDKKVQNNTIQM